MGTYLRLDMYVNGKEFLVHEAPATQRGFERCLKNASIVFQAADDEIRATGGTMLTAEQITDEDMQEVLWDFTDKEITAEDTVIYVICLWETDENGESNHIRSHVKLEEIENAE